MRATQPDIATTSPRRNRGYCDPEPPRPIKPTVGHARKEKDHARRNNLELGSFNSALSRWPCSVSAMSAGTAARLGSGNLEHAIASAAEVAASVFARWSHEALVLRSASRWQDGGPIVISRASRTAHGALARCRVFRQTRTKHNPFEEGSQWTLLPEGTDRTIGPASGKCSCQVPANRPERGSRRVRKRTRSLRKTSVLAG
jgi:hypothetical protein